MRIPWRGKEEARLVLVLGGCQASWHPAHITPLVHVQAAQDALRSQAGSIVFALQKHLLLERQKESWPELSHNPLPLGRTSICFTE